MSQFLKQNKVLNLEAKSIKIKPNNFAQTLVKLSLGDELLTVEVLVPNQLINFKVLINDEDGVENKLVENYD